MAILVFADGNELRHGIGQAGIWMHTDSSGFSAKLAHCERVYLLRYCSFHEARTPIIANRNFLLTGRFSIEIEQRCAHAGTIVQMPFGVSDELRNLIADQITSRLSDGNHAVSIFGDLFQLRSKRR